MNENFHSGRRPGTERAAHMAELGIAAAQGREGLKELLAIVANDEDPRLPVAARANLIVLAAQLGAMQTMIGSIEKRIMEQHCSSEASQRLETIPGIGIVGDPREVSDLPCRDQSRQSASVPRRTMASASSVAIRTLPGWRMWTISV